MSKKIEFADMPEKVRADFLLFIGVAFEPELWSFEESGGRYVARYAGTPEQERRDRCTIDWSPEV